MSFCTVSLGQYVDIRTGKLDANAADAGGEYPFFTCAKENLAINTYSYDCNALLIAGNGDLNVKHYSGKFDAYQRTYIVVSKDEKKLDTRYLYHFMDKYVEKLREQSIGGVIKYIKLGMLTEAKIPLPLINEQKRIASILDKADSIRRKRQEAIAMADEFLRSVFLDMFGDPVTNPKGWRIASLNEVSIIKGEYGSGSSAVSYADGDYRYIRITDITERGDLKEEKVGLSNSDTDGVKYQLKNGDLLFARTGATVGKTFLYEERYGKCAFAGYLIRFRFDEKQVLPEYIKAFTETGIYWDWIQSCQKIVAQPNINAKQYGEDLKIPIPPVNNQKEFIAVWKKIKSMKTQGDSFNREALLESLSQKAFSGDL